MNVRRDKSKAVGSVYKSFDHSGADNRMLRMIRCTDVAAADAAGLFSSEMYIGGTTVLLVADGEVQLSINRRMHTAVNDNAVVLSASHLVKIENCSDDFRGTLLAVGEEFMNEMDSVDMIYKRIRYGVKLYNKPIVGFGAEEGVRLRDRLNELQRAIGDTSHIYYREVVLNRLFAFYLDLSDTIDRKEYVAPSEHASRYESIVKRFIELLTANYRTEHKVEFYASHLNLSAHYLTLIVKEVTGRSVSDFVFAMLYSDARSLLAESGMSIQEITALLNFSDQSSFGKFFKRRSGLSPLDYRRQQR